MRKNFRLFIAAAVAVGVLIAALITVLVMPSEKENKITADDNNEILLFDKTALTAESITITNQGGEYELLAYEYTPESSAGTLYPTISAVNEASDDPNVIFTMQEYPDLMLDKSITNHIAAQCRYMAAKEVIDKTGQRDKEFGLEPPVATVKARFRDGSSVCFHIGGEAPDNKGTYLKMDGENNIYLVQNTLVDALLIERLQLFDKTMTGSIENVSSVTLSGKAYPEPIRITANGYTCYQSLYLMESPARYACDTNKTNKLLNNAFNLKPSLIYAVNATDQDIKACGLNDPYEILTIKGEDGSELTLIASAPDQQDMFCVMVKGGSMICQAKSAEYEFYHPQKENFLPDNVFPCAISEVKSLTVTKDGKAYDLLTEREPSLNDDYYETEIINVKKDGQKVDYNLYSLFVTGLSDLQRTAEKPDSLKGASELLRITYHYEHDSITDEFALYRDTSGKVFAVLNGNIECFVDETAAESLLSNIP